jgi:hypothetical protein
MMENKPVLFGREVGGTAAGPWLRWAAWALGSWRSAAKRRIMASTLPVQREPWQRLGRAVQRNTHDTRLRRQAGVLRCCEMQSVMCFTNQHQNWRSLIHWCCGQLCGQLDSMPRQTCSFLAPRFFATILSNKKVNYINDLTRCDRAMTGKPARRPWIGAGVEFSTRASLGFARD